MVTTICEESVVKGSGSQDHMANNCLRASMLSDLIDSGHSYSSIILHTGHTSVDTLTRYHNLQSVDDFSRKWGAFNSSFITLPFRTAELEASTKSKPECIQHSEGHKRDREVPIKWGTLPVNCTGNAGFAAMIGQPSSTATHNLISASPFGPKCFSTNQRGGGGGSGDQSVRCGISTNQRDGGGSGCWGMIINLFFLAACKWQMPLWVQYTLKMDRLMTITHVYKNWAEW